MLRFGVALAVCACGRVDFDSRGDGGSCAVTLSDARVNPSSYVALAPSAGTAPFTYTLAGPGAVLGDAKFVAPAYPATTTVTARDALGCTATATLTTAGDELFYISGFFNNAPSRETWRSSDAITWTRAGDLPLARGDAAAAVFHDAIWVIGGDPNMSTIGTNDVWSSRDGLTWVAAPAFPVAVTDTVAIAFRDELWLVGGHGNPGAVWSSPDGQSWTQRSTLPFPAHGGELAVVGDRMLYMGGHDDTTYYPTVYATTDGVTWTNIGTLPSKREFQATAMHDTTIVFAGGMDDVGFLGDSFRSTDGASWTPGGALPQARSYSQLQYFGDRFYLVGGADGDDVYSSADGSTWRIEATGLSHPRDAGALVQFTPH
ncbi:MAG: hypothetical protein JO257_18810 [Deltaproteobacteria bacterium]|nr:hypothetical protein [Deltaproteobacteria bacterium]